jgi:chemotaxis protein methyltransferase CheR
MTNSRAVSHIHAGRPADLLDVSPQTFRMLQRLLHEHCGIHLPEGKESLLTTRLSKSAIGLGMSSFDQYYREVTSDRSGRLLNEMVEALTTNHTSFFREEAHFEFLTGRVAAEFPAGRQMEIWSAACSTGEEPYSIAMTLIERCPALRFRIRATDISEGVLARAREGEYSEEKLAGVAPARRNRFFEAVGKPGDRRYRTRPALRAHVEYSRQNLMQQYRWTHPFHVIFLRNVMIYFTRETQAQLIQRMVEQIEPGGWLMVGHSESLTGIDCGLEWVRPAVYRKPIAAGRRA